MSKVFQKNPTRPNLFHSLFCALCISDKNRSAFFLFSPRSVENFVVTVQKYRFSRQNQGFLRVKRKTLPVENLLSIGFLKKIEYRQLSHFCTNLWNLYNFLSHLPSCITLEYFYFFRGKLFKLFRALPPLFLRPQCAYFVASRALASGEGSRMSRLWANSNICLSNSIFWLVF